MPNKKADLFQEIGAAEQKDENDCQEISAENNKNCQEQPQVSLLAQIIDTFSGKKADVRTFSPLTLAYIGDAVYDLIIRTIIVEQANRAANELHKRTVKYVNAGVQAAMIEALLEELTEEELAVYKRGRNAKSHTSAKNASIQEYRKATGFEALVGYLYLQDQTNRLLYLVKTGIDRIR